jgi:hypothetical protein
MAATYAYRTSMVRVTRAKEKGDTVTPSFNPTKPLGPPPTDAQVLRANIRRQEILKYRRKTARHNQINIAEKRHSRTSSAYEGGELDTLFLQFPLASSEPTASRKAVFAASMQEQTRPHPHITEQPRVESMLNSSVIDLSSTKSSLCSPYTLSTPGSSVELSLFNLQDTSAPMITSSRKPTDTLRIPERTLRLARRTLFDVEVDPETKGKLKLSPTLSDKNSINSRDRKPRGISFFDDSSREPLTASPTTRYVVQQHSLLKNAILHGKARARNQGQLVGDVG